MTTEKRPAGGTFSLLIGELKSLAQTRRIRNENAKGVFDRGKWRSMRQAVRRREYQDDVRDRQAEELEMVELEKQTEELLQKQMQEMADLEAKQRAAGYLFDDSAHIKVAIGGPAGSAPTASKQKTNIAFNGDDDDDAGKKKRTLIMLDDAEGLTPAQRDERHQDKLRAIKAAIPSDQATLWATKIKWGAAITVRRLS